MLIPDALDRLSLKKILHIGAHLCEERELYRRLGIHTTWIEANPNIARHNSDVINAVVSDKDGEEVEFIVTNNGQSSSILELKTHRTAYPDVVEVHRFKARTITIDTLFPGADFDSMNLDIQGAELKALRGACKALKNIRAIYTEVNLDELYAGCARIGEIDEFLRSFGFTRTDTRFTESGWGDALYIK
jgi:FkbM family methyltransferase